MSENVICSDQRHLIDRPVPEGITGIYLFKYEAEQALTSLPYRKEARMSERLSRFGARLGNWNDRHFAGDTRFDRRWPWHWLDRIASWLYTMPDRRGGV